MSAATNRAKGDQGPEDWQPPAKGYWCTYATAWTNVKSAYQLTVTEGERKKLTEMLGTCSWLTTSPTAPRSPTTVPFSTGQLR